MNIRIALICLSFAAFASAKPANIQLSVFVSTEDLNSLLNDPTLERTHLEESEALRPARNASLMASPSFYFDQRLVATIAVGSPPQNFRVAVETGTTKMFLFDWSYPGEWRQEISYDPEKSNTAKNLKKEFATRTGGIEAKGKTYQDILQFRDLDFAQNFGVVNNMDFNGTFPEHGVLGLGWLPRVEKIIGPESSPVLNLLLKRGDESLKYTLVVREHAAPVIVWGTARLRTNPPLTIFPHGSGEHITATVAVFGFRFDRFESTLPNRATFDTGYSVIALPGLAYTSVLAQIKPKFDAALGNFVVDCGANSVRQPAISFLMGGIWYSVRQHHYILDRDFPNEQCVLALARSWNNVFYLGLPFLRTAAVVFDAGKDTIALAPYKWDMVEPVPS